MLSHFYKWKSTDKNLSWKLRCIIPSFSFQRDKFKEKRLLLVNILRLLWEENKFQSVEIILYKMFSSATVSIGDSSGLLHTECNPMRIKKLNEN